MGACFSGFGRTSFNFASESHLKAKVAGSSRLPLGKMRFDVPAGSKGAVAIVACGSFSPPTVSHLRIFEDAKDALQERGYYVVGGFLSPVHKDYGKKSLAAMHDRVNMCIEASGDSTWIATDPWEAGQGGWELTASVLARFQAELDLLHQEKRLPTPARAALLCGADLVESFGAIKDNGDRVWSLEDQETIVGKCGVVCIARKGTDMEAIVKKNDILQRNRQNLHVVEPALENNVSSTVVRKLLVEGKSLKYAVSDKVIDYISKHSLHKLPQWQ